jgi:CBS domain containing-hemolysin-like protein
MENGKDDWFERVRGWFPGLQSESGNDESGQDPPPSQSPRAAARREMAHRLTVFGDLTVADVMVPKADITAVEASMGLLEAARAFVSAGHSRLPLYRETLDQPLGMVHIKDLLDPVACRLAGQDMPEGVSGPNLLEKLAREVLYVPPSANTADLLLTMQAKRVHMALVVDEYGGTDGLVTIEDLIEQIVGDIEDQPDEDQPALMSLPSGGWQADARLEIAAFEDEAKVTIDQTDHEDVETLGGLVFSLLNRVPARGEIVHHPSGLEFEITGVDARRIHTLIVRQNPRSPGESQASDAG